MSEFELLDFEAEDDDTENTPEASESLFLQSAHERCLFHRQALEKISDTDWQNLFSQLELNQNLQAQLNAAGHNLPDLELADAGLLLEALQPLLAESGEGQLAHHLYHGLAAAYFLKYHQTPVLPQL
jgi:hypothetical protein